MKKLIPLCLVFFFATSASADFSFTSIQCTAELDMNNSALKENLIADIVFKPLTPKKADDPNVESTLTITGKESQIVSKPTIEKGYIFESSEYAKSTNVNNYTLAYSKDQNNHTEGYKFAFDKTSLKGYGITHLIDKNSKHLDSLTCELTL